MKPIDVLRKFSTPRLKKMLAAKDTWTQEEWYRAVNIRLYENVVTSCCPLTSSVVDIGVIDKDAEKQLIKLYKKHGTKCLTEFSEWWDRTTDRRSLIKWINLILKERNVSHSLS